MEDLQKLPSSDWIGGGTQTNIVVTQERAPCTAAIEGGLRQGFMPSVLELRESRGAASSACPPLGAPCRRVLPWLDPRDLPKGSADYREDTSGPETTDPGQGAADLATGH